MLQIVMVGAALMSTGSDLNRGVNPRTLAAALAAPESKRMRGEGPRYCVFARDHQLSESGHRPDEQRRICRTRREWVALGVQPLTS